ncbi:MAG: cytidine deaminase [Bacteroidales bacterium]|nr:cytidine deaminase [Bacteroidales bacterium]
MRKEITIAYEEYPDESALPAADAALLRQARRYVDNAYAPYSDFKVGAALRLADGTVVCGSNQENVAFPSGLCAERVAVFSAGANYPDVPIEALAVTARAADGQLTDYPISPCGACRQSLIEYEQRYGHKIRVILQGGSGKVVAFDGIDSLLPFQFEAEGIGAESEPAAGNGKSKRKPA